MNYEKELCYEKDEFVEGIELVHTSIQRIEEYIRELRRVYLSSLNSEQLNILRDLQNSLYIEEFKRYYQHLHESDEWQYLGATVESSAKLTNYMHEKRIIKRVLDKGLEIDNDDGEKCKDLCCWSQRNGRFCYRS